MRNQEVSSAGAGVCGANAPSEPPLSAGGARSYQSRVMDWMDACFGDDITNDPLERSFRLWEESLELGQAEGATAEDAHRLVDYVFGRPVGEGEQEVGGVAVCLAALCGARGYDLDACAERELARIWTKVSAIRAKHAAKPKDVRSSLPGYAAAAADDGPLPPQPHDQPAADDASGMTKDQEIADLKRRLSLIKERLPSEKPRGPDLSGDGGDWRNYPEAP